MSIDALRLSLATFGGMPPAEIDAPLLIVARQVLGLAWDAPLPLDLQVLAEHADERAVLERAWEISTSPDRMVENAARLDDANPGIHGGAGTRSFVAHRAYREARARLVALPPADLARVDAERYCADAIRAKLPTRALLWDVDDSLAVASTKPGA